MNITKEICLPPGFHELSSKDYGWLKIHFGNIFWINTNDSINNLIIKVKFWGENEGNIFRAKNTIKNDIPNTKTYTIKSGIMEFHQYLSDMGKIKIIIIDNKTKEIIGFCIINLLIFLRRNLNENDLTPIEDLNDVFPIMRGNGKNTEKIGELEFQMQCLFEKKIQRTPSEHSREIRGKYCRPKIESPQKDDSFLNIEKITNEIQNFDNRIAKSLQPHIENQYNVYDFKKKEEKIQKTEKIEPDKISKDGTLFENKTFETKKCEKNETSFTSDMLDNLLKKGKSLQNKLENIDFKENINEINIAEGIFSEINRKEQQNTHMSLFGEKIIGNKALPPELESLKLKLDEAIYTDETRLSKNIAKEENLLKFDLLNLRIISFTCLNNEIKERLKDVFLEINIPELDEFLTFSKKRAEIQELEDLTLFFNQDFETILKFTEINKQIILDEKIKFKIIKNNVEISQSEFPIRNLLQNSKFQNVFSLEFFTKQSTQIEKPKPKPKKEVTIKSKNKKEEPEKKIIPIFESMSKIGSLKIFLSLKKTEKKQIIIPKITENQTVSTSILPSNYLLGFQIFLFLEKIINIKNESNEIKNLFIRYKIYSTSETVETKIYYNDPSPVLDHKMYMSINNDLLEKINKVPLVIEIWNKSIKNQLLGLVHLDLSPISESISKEKSALKVSKFPLIIYDDILKIKSLMKNEEKGEIKLQLAFGTLNQINKYESFIKENNINSNQIFEQKIEKNEKITINNTIKEKNIEINENIEQINENKNKDVEININLNTIESINDLFCKIRENLKQISSKLRNFIENSQKNHLFSKNDFFIFIQSLELNINEIQILKISEFFKENSESINIYQFIESFRYYSNLLVFIKNKFKNIFQEISEKIKNFDFENEILNLSVFGYLENNKFKFFLKEKLLLTNEKIDFLIEFFMKPDENFIVLDLFFNILNTKIEIDENLIKNTYFLIYNIIENIKEKIVHNSKILNKNIKNIDKLTTNKIRIEEILYFFNENNLNLSKYEIFNLCFFLNKFENEDKNIEKQIFMEFLTENLSKIERIEMISPIKNSKEENYFDEIEDLALILNDKPEKTSNIIEIKEIEKLENLNEKKQEIQSKSEIIIKNTEIIEKQDEIIIKNKEISQIKENKEFIEEYSHKKCVFKIKCNYLNEIDLKEKNGCFIYLKYIFPNEEKEIEANLLEFSNQIKEYKFEMKSTHSFLLKKEENIINLINNRQNIIIYLLSKNGLKENIQAKAIIPISDFFKLSSKKKNINTEIIKFDNDYPLNSNDLNKNEILKIANLNINLTYKEIYLNDFNHQKLTNQKQLWQKETNIQKFLPKNGFITILIENITNFQNGLSKLNISEYSEDIQNKLKSRSFHSCIFLSIFNEEQDLNEIYKGFETPRVFEKLSYNLNYDYNYKFVLNELILDYLKEKNGYMELRIYFNDLIEDFIVLGRCEFPLIDLLIKSSGIKSEFQLKNQFNENIASINLMLNIINSIPEKKTNKFQSVFLNPNIVFQLNINEILIGEDFFVDSKNYIELSFEFNQRVYKSRKYEITRGTKQFEMDDNYFSLYCNNVQKISTQILEIKILINDEIQGYINIDFPVLFLQQKNDFLHSNDYYTVINSNFVSASALKIRFGINIFAFLFENETLFEKNKKFVKELNQKNLKIIQDKSEKNLNEDYFELLKSQFNFSKIELTKFLNLIGTTDITELKIILQNKIKNNLNIEEIENTKELLEEFQFYDYDNNGFIDYDNALKIFYIFETTFKKLKIPDFKKFVFPNSYSSDQNMQILKFDQKFDYLLFLNKITLIPYEIQKKTDYALIYKNTEQLKNYFTNKLETIIPKKFLLTILEGRNFSLLNNGTPPNVYISIERFNIKTQIAYRQINPIWNESFKIINLSENDTFLNLDVISRAFNSKNDTKMNMDSKLASLKIDLQKVYKYLNDQDEFIENFKLNKIDNCELFIKIENLTNFNEIYQEDNLEKNQDELKNLHQTLQEIRNLNNINNENELFYKSDSPKKLDKTIIELDELKGSLMKMLNRQNIEEKNFSFGNKDNSNPFENYLYKTTLQSQIKSDKFEKSVHQNEIFEKIQSSPEKKLKEDIIFQTKPPLARNNSLNNLKKIEKSMKDSQEFERIAKIMKEDISSKTKKFYDISSDSDY